MPYLVIIVALIVLVVLHELGHFLAARAVGVRATKFYVFFPPAIFKKQIGDVEYGIGAIPAGGFVRLPGMFEPAPRDVAERLRWELDRLAPVLDAEAKLHVQAARRQVADATSADGMVLPLTEIERELARVRPGVGNPSDRTAVERTRERVVGMIDDVHPKAYWRAALWRRMVVIAAGPFVNLLVAFIVLTTFYMAFIPNERVDGSFRAVVVPDSPASIAGMTSGSRISSFDGPVDGLSLADFTQQIREAHGTPITATWTPEGSSASTTRTIFPAAIGGDRVIGVGVDVDRTRTKGHLDVPFGRALHVTALEVRDITWGNLTRLPKVFFDRGTRKEVSSVVGIVHTAKVVDQAGQTIRYIGLISLILAVMNVLPLLPLDGGHLLFGIIESFRRRPLPKAAFERYSMFGMALVLLLFFIGLDNDIGRMRG